MQAMHNLVDKKHQLCKRQPAGQRQLAGGLATMKSRGMQVRKKGHIDKPTPKKMAANEHKKQHLVHFRLGNQRGWGERTI